LFSESKVIAFEKDNNRCQLLTKRVKLYNTVQNISVMNDDFLLVNPKDFPKVEVILCDPSCSGSGTLNNHYSDIIWTTTFAEARYLRSQYPEKEYGYDWTDTISNFIEIAPPRLKSLAMALPSAYDYKIDLVG
jgi:hypothetical protein